MRRVAGQAGCKPRWLAAVACTAPSDLTHAAKYARLPLLPPASFVFRISMPPSVRIELVRKMADIEHRLAYGTSDRLQLGALCGAFAGARSGGVESLG